MIQLLQRGKDRLSVGRCGQQGMRVYRLVLLCGTCRAIAVTGRVRARGSVRAWQHNKDALDTWQQPSCQLRPNLVRCVSTVSSRLQTFGGC